ncbi:MAG TPA: hypothetical protein VMT66_12215 [Steroidobacteraceae bacterium]|nr:hypothetical protein [Steroidobacteraceae bacterium]
MNQETKNREIKAEDIQQYLDSRDDFDLELFAYRSLREHGWPSSLGGSYVDPALEKPRQFDVRSRRAFHLGCYINLAVECKSLSPEFPLVVSRVPRPTVESQHDVIRRFWRPEQSDSSFVIERSGTDQLRLYTAEQPVGKSATQIRWDGKRLVASDAETYDKWAQALASAAELVETAANASADKKKPIFEFVMPVLLINDRTLWVVDYTEQGVRGTPTPAEDATLFVDRKRVVKGRYASGTYHLSHLHICTRAAFVRMLKNLDSATGSLFERIFGFAIRRADEAGLLSQR